MRFTATLFMLAIFVLTLSACNTVEGLGEDLQEASENTSEAISGDRN